ncbi:MAG: 4'-phosphopantetheinyl transferase superfamily protein [Cyclobacteriaceae bacterium]|nr:4'-phosphopantetheinyl transferase superfamily protein [Cyclobacteriaceae bacterium]
MSKIETMGPHGAWGLWFISEEEPDLSYLSYESCPDDIVHPQKRLEYLAGRALIKTLVEEMHLTYEGIRKDEFGKPSLKTHPHAISLSHSYPYVAAQIDRHVPVGIDVEQVKEKLRLVGPRILSPGEVRDAGDNLVKLCIYWCAKEALYKIHGKRNLLFGDHLKIQPFPLEERGSLRGMIDVENSPRSVLLGYHVTKEYVVVFTDTRP